MSTSTILGIDMGGTNLRAGLVIGKQLTCLCSQQVPSQGSVEEVRTSLFHFIDPLIDDAVTAIGIGVPGLVDPSTGMVCDMVNIPAWKEVPLQQWLQERYHRPVLVENDANCFALGEFYYGKGRGHDSMVGLTVGTGLGSGLILNKKLYTGQTGGAGEFGMIPYLDHCYEYYASGQFFKNVSGIDGETVFQKAKAGDLDALQLYAVFGTHLANAIQAILFALDTDLIVLGGSVRHAFPYFSAALWKQLQTFSYQKIISRLAIEVSELDNSGILGAAALYHNR